MKNSIEIANLHHHYDDKGEISALDNINLSVKPGQLYGLIGPDGAGKTTLFRILTTLLIPSSGTAVVHGFDIANSYQEIRKIVGYMPGKFSLYQDLTVEENLNFFATIFNTSVKENYHLIKDIYTHLEAFKKRKAGALSGGMKQKLALCCALVHKPEVLFLDEPTTGVDSVSRKEFWEMLKRLKQSGITVFVSTPYMDEASLCDEIALIQNGRILSNNTPYQLIQEFSNDLFAVRTKNMFSAYQDLSQMKAVSQVHSFGSFHHVQLNPTFNPETIQSALDSYGHSDIEVKKIEPSIEDCFIELMTKTNPL